MQILTQYNADQGISALDLKIRKLSQVLEIAEKVSRQEFEGRQPFAIMRGYRAMARPIDLR